MAHCRPAAPGAGTPPDEGRSVIAVRPLPAAARAAVLVGALWRVGMLVVDKWSQPLLLNDSLYYSAQARQLADGVWFREIFVDRPGAEHAGSGVDDGRQLLRPLILRRQGSVRRRRERGPRHDR